MSKYLPRAYGARYIITRNGRDVTASLVSPLSPEEFLAQYPLR
jgi:hypothetical protein